jgi:hypothetical protein
MFPPVPPREDPPAQQEVYLPPEPEPTDYMPPTRLGPSARVRVVRFALVGGGITSIIGGIVMGWLIWAASGERAGVFGGPGDFIIRPRLAPTIFTTMLALAPLLFVSFALGGAAQVIAESMSRAAGRAARQLGEVLGDSAGERKPRRSRERGVPVPGTAAEIIRPLVQDLNLQIDSEPPARQ